jgi:hypothetical protein
MKKRYISISDNAEVTMVRSTQGNGLLILTMAQAAKLLQELLAAMSQANKETI